MNRRALLARHARVGGALAAANAPLPSREWRAGYRCGKTAVSTCGLIAAALEAGMIPEDVAAKAIAFLLG
jgi:hypothetical protein